MCVCVCVCVPACHATVQAPRVARRGPAVFTARPATDGGRACACSFVPPAVLAAGVSWTSRTLKAGWAARWGHSTVIDAAGAIYVIGGRNGTTYFNDVLVSTDGGALPDSVKGVLGWGTQGGTAVVLRGYYRVRRGYGRGTREVPRGTAGYRWYSTVYTRDAEVYSTGTLGVLSRVLGGTRLQFPLYFRYSRGNREAPKSSRE